MGNLIGFIVGLVVFAAIIRALRSKYVWVDYVFIALVVIGAIVVWVSSGFWYALGFFLLGCFVMSLLLGLGHQEEIRYNGKRYVFECKECGYNHLEVVSQEGNCVVTRCKRCGKIVPHTLI